MLPSLRIQGFRCFRDLTIPRLGRVNLVVGRNNTGKTTLLEALSVYAAGLDAAWEIKRVLESRRETRVQDDGATRVDVDRIFHCASGRQAAEVKRFEISSADAARADLYVAIRTDAAEWRGHDLRTVDLPEAELFVKHGERERTLPLSRLAHSAVSYATAVADSSDGPQGVASYLVPSAGLDDREIARLWRGIALTDSEDDVVTALRIVEPAVERITVMADPGHGDVSILARRRGVARRETLASLGDGMQRLFALALGLAEARGGLFLADEIERGLHHSVHEAMWRFVAATAKRLDVQVVATTHRWDCIEGFQAAAINDSVLIRLDRRGEDISAVLFDERDVAIAARQSIDIR